MVVFVRPINVDSFVEQIPHNIDTIGSRRWAISYTKRFDDATKSCPVFLVLAVDVSAVFDEQLGKRKIKGCHCDEQWSLIITISQIGICSSVQQKSDESVRQMSACYVKRIFVKTC